MRGDDERHYPPGVVPGAVGALGLVAAAVLVLGVAFGLLLAFCDRREPVQMMPAASSTATASAQVGGIQRIRVTIPQDTQKPALDVAQQGPRTSSRGQSVVVAGLSPDPSQSPGKGPSAEASNGAGSGAIVIEFEQALSAAATSSAGASASTTQDYPDPASFRQDHGRFGVIAATMPGILAADLQLLSLDVSPVTRWLVDVDMELGVDTIVNFEAIGSGVTVGGKSFVGVYGWSRWDMSGSGLAIGAGLRF